MLKSDLLRVRRNGEHVKPTWIRANNKEFRQRASEAIVLFENSVGSRRLELDQDISDFLNKKGDKRIGKALMHLLDGMCEFESVTQADPTDLRTALFEAASSDFPVGTQGTLNRRASIVEECAEQFGLSPSQVEQAMFADLKDQQRLVAFDAPEVEALVQRYNVAQAQGLLLTAYYLDIRLSRTEPARLRQLLRYLKFFQLLFRTDYDGSTLMIRVDGPKSVLKQTRAYGIKLASFLPALLLLDRFEMTAPVLWKRKKSTFILSHKDNLISHYKDRGAWVPKEFDGFRERLSEKLPSGLSLAETTEVHNLGGRDFYVPDVAFVRRGKPVAWVEIIWPWRKFAWGPYYELFRRHAPDNALLLVPKKSAGKTFLERNKDPRIISFRKTPLAPAVVKSLKAILK